MTDTSDCLSITAAQLVAWRACPEAVQIFRATFGEEVPVTEEALARALAAGLDIRWLVRHTLNVPAQREFERAHASAWTEYERVCAPALAAAWAEYARERAPALAEYNRARASAWFHMYRIPGNRKELIV